MKSRRVPNNGKNNGSRRPRVPANKGKWGGKRPVHRSPEWVAARRAEYVRLAAEVAAAKRIVDAVWEIERALSDLGAARGESLNGRVIVNGVERDALDAPRTPSLLIAELVHRFDLQIDGTTKPSKLDHFVAALPDDLHSEDLDAITGGAERARGPRKGREYSHERPEQRRGGKVKERARAATAEFRQWCERLQPR